jgi:hypothetical protein
VQAVGFGMGGAAAVVVEIRTAAAALERTMTAKNAEVNIASIDDRVVSYGRICDWGNATVNHTMDQRLLYIPSILRR